MFKVILAQIIFGFTLIHIPLTLVIISFRYKIFYADQIALGSLLATSLHTPFEYTVLIYFMKPYREVVISFLRKTCCKNLKWLKHDILTVESSRFYVSCNDTNMLKKYSKKLTKFFCQLFRNKILSDTFFITGNFKCLIILEKLPGIIAVRGIAKINAQLRNVEIELK